ncbi:hypothetical protein OG936_38695 (plasmid) [Streptomyces sp. NBC_00846]|uniref:hypothetical protein n=1 Tax=Streptomyces sp. NBC_00846 TaxID=2975849 RepID=UPI002F91BC48|nr:hypothetical protein OG936_38695 [Streptomyces sp. NBC_00846]
MRRNIRAKPDVASRFPGGSACAHPGEEAPFDGRALVAQLRGRLSAAAAAAGGEYPDNDELFIAPDFRAPRLKARRAEKPRGSAQVPEQAVYAQVSDNDLPRVAQRILARGNLTAAMRQRAMHEKTGQLVDVVSEAVRERSSGP